MKDSPIKRHLVAGGHFSGIRETRGEPAAFRLLREANRNHTGLSSPCVFHFTSMSDGVAETLRSVSSGSSKQWMKQIRFQRSFSESWNGFRRGSSERDTNTPSWPTGGFDFRRYFLLSFVFLPPAALMVGAFCRAWDMSKFLNIQCRISRIRYPQFAKKWINIRKSYCNFYKVCYSEMCREMRVAMLGCWLWAVEMLAAF